MKKCLVCLSVIVFVACDPARDNSVVMEEKNVAVAKSLFERFNKHEWQQMAALYSDTADFKDPSFGVDAVKQTRKQTIEKYTEYQRVSPDINDSIVRVYPSGDKYVTVEFVSTGTAPGGIKWRMPIVTIFTIENGMITTDNTYYDKQ